MYLVPATRVVVVEVVVARGATGLWSSRELRVPVWSAPGLATRGEMPGSMKNIWGSGPWIEEMENVLETKDVISTPSCPAPPTGTRFTVAVLPDRPRRAPSGAVP